MLVEIPDPEIILGIVIAFIAGLFALHMFNKIKSSNTTQEKRDFSSYDRLEYYERQLIDMKIRLDSLEIMDEGKNYSEMRDSFPKLDQVPKQQYSSEEKPKRVSPKLHQTPNLDNSSTVDFVLRLITNKSMTSRDIQNASQRSREHISRLMKKLYQDGYVKRNTNTKPFTYSITDKGKAKIGILEHMQNITA